MALSPSEYRARQATERAPKKKYGRLITFDRFLGEVAKRPEMTPEQREQEIGAYVNAWDDRRTAAETERARVGQGVEMDYVLEDVEKQAEALYHPDLPAKVVLWNQLRDYAGAVVPKMEGAPAPAIPYAHEPPPARVGEEAGVPVARGWGRRPTPMVPTPEGPRMPAGAEETYGTPEFGRAALQRAKWGTLGYVAGAEPWKEEPIRPYGGPSPLQPYKWQLWDPETGELKIRPGAEWTRKAGRFGQATAEAGGALLSEPQLALMAAGPVGGAVAFGTMSATGTRQEQLARDWERQQRGEAPEGFGAAEAVELAGRTATGAVTGALIGPTGRMAGRAVPSAPWVAAIPAEAGLLTADQVVEQAISGDPHLDPEALREQYLHNLMFLGGMKVVGGVAGRARAAITRAVRGPKPPPGTPAGERTPGFEGQEPTGPITSSQTPLPVVGAEPRARRPGEPVEQGVPAKGEAATTMPGEQLPPEMAKGFISSRQPGAPGATVAEVPRHQLPSQAVAAAAISRGELPPRAAEAVTTAERALAQRVQPGARPPEPVPLPPRAAEAVGAAEQMRAGFPQPPAAALTPPPQAPITGLVRPGAAPTGAAEAVARAAGLPRRPVPLPEERGLVPREPTIAPPPTVEQPIGVQPAAGAAYERAMAARVAAEMPGLPRERALVPREGGTPIEMPPPPLGPTPTPKLTPAERAVQALRQATRAQPPRVAPGQVPPTAEGLISSQQRGAAPIPVAEGIPAPAPPARPIQPPQPRAQVGAAKERVGAKPKAPRWRDEELRQEIEAVEQRIRTGKNLRGEPLTREAFESDQRFVAELRQRLTDLQQQQQVTGQRQPAVVAVRAGRPPAAPELAAPAPTPRAPEKPPAAPAAAVPEPMQKPPLRKRKPGEAGLLWLGRRRPKVETQVTDSEVAEVIKRPERESTPISLVREMKEAIGRRFGYEWEVRGDPEFVEQLRQIKDEPQSIMERNGGKIAKSLGNLMKKGREDELELLREIFFLRGVVEREKKPGGQPGGLRPQQYRDSLAQLETRATSDVKAGLQDLRELYQEAGREAVRRGWMPEKVLETKDYFPHQVLDFSQYLQRALEAGGVGRLREVRKGFTLRAKGTQRFIDTDVVSVTWRYLNNVEMAAKLDDFATRILSSRDVMGKLTAQERAYIGETPTHGQRFMLRGYPYKAYQYRPRGNQYYLVTNPIEQVGLDAVMPPIKGHERIYMVPERVANRLERWRGGGKEMEDFSKNFMAFHSFWKRLLLDSIGLPYDIRNFFGDNLHFLAEEGILRDLGAVFPLRGGREVAQYSMALLHPELFKNAKYRDWFRDIDVRLLDKLMNGRVAQSAGFYGAEIPRVKYRRLREITGEIGPVKSKALGVLDGYEYLRQHRENWLRIRKAILDWNRIQNGQPVKTKVIDVKGLTPEDAVVKVARGFPTDYGAVTPWMGDKRKWLAPFLTWYVHQMKYWPRYAWKHPWESTAKFGTLLAGLYYWNTVVQTEQEKLLPKWQRMIPLRFNTGWWTDEGEPITVTFPTGLDVVAQVLNIDKLIPASQEYLWGEIDEGELLREVIPGPMLGIPELALQLAGPVVQTAIGLGTGKDPFTKRSILQPADIDPGSWRAVKQYSWYAFSKMTPPLMIWEQTVRRAERDPDFRAHETVGRYVDLLLQGPLNWQRGIGRYDNRGAVEIQRRNIEAIDRENNQRKEVREQLKETYIRAVISGDYTKFRKLLRDAVGGKLATRVSLKDWQRWSQSPKFRQQLALERSKAAKTPEERKKWLKSYERWGITILREAQRRRPASAREAARMKQIMRNIDRPLIPAPGGR